MPSKGRNQSSSGSSDLLWREIAGYEGKYAVSNRGDVKRLAHSVELLNRWGTITIRPVAELLLKPTVRKGYHEVGLWLGAKCKIRRVSVLVCEAFNGPRPTPDSIARHYDGDRLNNTPENLWWGSHQDNADDRARHMRTARGTRQHSAVLDEQTVLGIREAYSAGQAIRALARKHGVAQTTVQRVIRRTTWTHI